MPRLRKDSPPKGFSLPRPPRTDYLTPRLRAKPKPKKKRRQDANLADAIGFIEFPSYDDFDDVEET
jgi:hypothetical protein